jgi:hypothetical protein
LDLTLILTVGKYAILVAIYAFVLVVFRGIIRQLAVESKRGQEAARGASARSRRAQRRPSRAQPAPEPEAELEPQAEPPSREPQVQPQEPPAPEPEREQPAAASPLQPAARRASRIDLLSEPEDEFEVQPQAPAEPTTSPAAEPPPAAATPADREPEAPAPHLRVLESGDESLQARETVPLSAAVTIGRSEENSLQVADRFISSRHAMVCLRDGRRILVDRGSTNGTFVNGDRVEDEVELSEGDRIALGNTVLEYHAG